MKVSGSTVAPVESRTVTDEPGVTLAEMLLTDNWPPPLALVLIWPTVEPPMDTL